MWRAVKNVAYPKLWGIETTDPRAHDAGLEIVVPPCMPEHAAKTLSEAYNLAVPTQERQPGELPREPGTCRCGAAPINADGLCATCADENYGRGRRGTYDSKCLDLAQYFLCDQAGDSASLAQTIQEAIEGWFSSQEDRPLTADELSLIDSAWEAHKAAAPVARVIDDNQPGKTAVIEVLIDPPTLAVGTELYASTT